jgi:hypothetical protein
MIVSQFQKVYYQFHDFAHGSAACLPQPSFAALALPQTTPNQLGAGTETQFLKLFKPLHNMQ